MTKCRVYMPIGSMGGGLFEDFFEMGLKMNPDIIAVDGGSTDSGRTTWEPADVNTPGRC